MTRYEKLKNLTLLQVAEFIVKDNLTDQFCKSDCDVDSEDLHVDCCPHPLECCIKWLNEEEEE